MSGQDKTQTIATLMIFLLAATLLLTPLSSFVLGYNNTQQYFNVTLTISNSPPAIQAVGAASDTPNEGTTKAVTILFNVTDDNGFGTVDPTLATANVTLNGVTRFSSSCSDYAAWTGGTTRGVTCTIDMNYYDESGLWTIDVYAIDDASSNATQDEGNNLTYNTLYAFSLTSNSISFTAAGAGVNNVNASDDPQTLNNTGNGDFATINVTADELTNGVDTIGAGNFTINSTDDAKGIALTANIIIPSANLSRNTTQDLYVWVDVPAGISNGSYSTNASTQWLVEAYN
ncbi:hypothetical protein GOV04_05630 [Candidatus Woesearchaeota archaeon]|nr:hypothetical protein [Candidatus Woesearchaeota archaeon]